MEGRLLKEFRCLLFPFLIAVGASLPMAARMGFDRTLLDSVEPLALRFLLEIAPTLFYVALALAAALSYGVEFQNRTLPMLLSQPLSRVTIWSEKLLVLATVAIAGAVAYTLATHALNAFGSSWFGPQREAHNWFTTTGLLGATFVLATICSAGFWTLVARSTIGGMALGAASQCVVLLGVTDLVVRICGPDMSFDDSRNIAAIVGAGLIHAAVFQWLGWRRFAGLQLRFGMTGEASTRPESFAGIKLDFDWLRCRPTGSTLNLIRKEVRLNKSVFLVATVFAICWLLGTLLLFLIPRGHGTLVMILNILTTIYVPALFLLAGCASLGEEKSLGLNAWQLTLPIAATRQWLLKLVVSVIIALMLGVLLPWLLSWTAAIKADVGLYAMAHEKGELGLQFVCIAGLLVLLVSFWAATLVNSTLVAALITIIAFPAFGCCAIAADEWAPAITSLVEFCLLWFIAHFQLPPNYFLGHAWQGGVYFLILPLGCVLLAQSFVQFRRLQAQGRHSLRHALMVALLAFLLFFIHAGFSNAAIQMYSTGVRFELEQAARALLTRLPLVSTETRPIKLEELESSGHLSELAKGWLRNTSISARLVPAPRRGSPSYLITVTFPDGRNELVSFQMPASRTP